MVFKCKMCGGDITPVEGKNIAQCSYCKSTMTLPNLENEKIVNLYNRANDFRLSNEFDKAYGVYETILEMDNKQVEAHWGLLLCKYGVEYIDDPKTGTKIPTCHRTMTTSILKDPEFKIIKDNSYGEALELYNKEAKRIDEIQKGILEVSSKEDPYDIFICYKETDANGERTHDSVIAQDIYEKLTNNNYKVFFARITLENKLGSEYEPYIYSALNSSKVMLVVGTTEENFNAVWVKNEWSRYLEMMKTDKSKTLIPVYSKIDAYKLPEEFVMLQAQSMDKIGAMQDLTHGIQKLIDESKDKKVSDTDVQKIKQAMDEASNLGNGKYEVVVMKEKTSTWYYGFVLLVIMLFGITRMFDGVDALFSIYNAQRISLYDFATKISIIKLIPYMVSTLLSAIALIMPLFGRKKYKMSKHIILAAIAFELIAIGVYAHYGLINLNIVPFGLQFIFWLINPKWHIDSSLKLVMDKEGKDKTQALNEEIVKNFKEKDKKIVKKRYYIILAILTVLIVIIDLCYVFVPNGNGKDEMEDQLKISSSRATIYSTQSLRNPIASAKEGEYYDILEEIKADKWQDYKYIYKVRTNKGMEGYIPSTRVQIIYGKNSPLYGKTQANDRDTTKLQIKITTEFLNMREKASQTSELLGQVYEGEIYTVLDEKKTSEKTWYKIKTTFGVEGYVADRYNNDSKHTVTLYVERLEPTK